MTRRIKVHLRAEVPFDIYGLNGKLFALRILGGHRTITPGEVGTSAVCGVLRAPRLVDRKQMSVVTCERCRIQAARNSAAWRGNSP